MAVLLLLGITIWSCWPTMQDIALAWRHNDDYSAGQLVPFVAVFLLWRDKKALKGCPLIPCWWAGIGLLVLSQAAHLYSLLYGARPSIGHYAMVLTLVSLVILVAGWQMVRRTAWILLMLFLMVPLPTMVHARISDPLQRVATTGSVFLLEAAGVSVSQQGNVVMLNGVTPLAVAEACSGLRMLMAFVIVAAFIAYMVKRPRWQKGVLLASSIPVAVVCNMLRIAATAVLMLYVDAEFAQKFFHDFAGYVMMPAAVMLLFGELWLLDRIIVPDSASHAGPAGPKGKAIVRARRASPANPADCA